MTEKRYYAMAINDQGESVEMRRIPQPDKSLAQVEHGLFPCDARWHMEGYYHAPKLAIETREKRNSQWVVTDTHTFDREVR